MEGERWGTSVTCRAGLCSSWRKSEQFKAQWSQVQSPLLKLLGAKDSLRLLQLPTPKNLCAQCPESGLNTSV